jgi:hypothetical protein
MMTSKLSLIFRKVDCRQSPPCLAGELRIDGLRLGERYVLDVGKLLQALDKSGEYFIFTCGCGVPDCADITEGVKSVVLGDQVKLVGSLPKGGDFSYVLSVTQSHKAVIEALLSEKALLDGASEWEEGDFPVFGLTNYSYRALLKSVT